MIRVNEKVVSINKSRLSHWTWKCLSQVGCVNDKNYNNNNYTSKDEILIIFVYRVFLMEETFIMSLGDP